MTTAVAVGISLETDCDWDVCQQFAGALCVQLETGPYDLCSVMRIPDTFDDWQSAHRTARKRAARAANRGYQVRQIERQFYEPAIHDINTSLKIRQGKPMARAYREPQHFSPLPDYPCRRHAIKTWGILTHFGELVGYLTIYRAGELALVSQILGHGDYLDDEIMYLLFAVAMSHEIAEPGWLVYNRHDSGTEGLRFFKERLGFSELEVRWEQ